MWSLGVIVFILLVGYMPFSGSTERAQIQMIKQGKFTDKKERWAKVSSSARDFVLKLLVVDPEKRLNAEEALKHPWIANRESAASSMDQVDQQMVDSLLEFARASQFRRQCMQMMAWSLSNEERKEVRDAFLEMDKSGTGVIKLTELRCVLQERFHVEDGEINKVFQALDSNHDDEIEYSEFLAAMMTCRLHAHDELLEATFKRFDKDNSGFITLSDLQKVFGPSFDTKQFEKLIREVDTNGDGKIEVAEFISFMRHGASDEQK